LTIKDDVRKNYMLATGAAAIDRLMLLNEIFGPGTEEVLQGAGLAQGMRVAEIGCGAGLTALWIARCVGSSGLVTAVDSSSDQLLMAEQNAKAAGLTNVSFREASAYQTGLLQGSFDLAFSRFLMCHLSEPVKALREMRRILKPGGILVCEDHDDGGIFTEPPTHAYKRLVEISEAVNRLLGLESYIGIKLPRIICEAGFQNTEVRVKQHAFLRGPGKRFWEITLREAKPAIVAAKAATSEELESLSAEITTIARDESILVMLARVTQVWAQNSQR
jgi:ubiquinone/menaquinone biosynthesis C-methylase UbiE